MASGRSSPRSHIATALPCLVVAAAIVLGITAAEEGYSFDYSNVFSAGRDSGISFGDLPGFTRSVYSDRHALITPESRVWAALPGWKNALTAHVISPASNHGTNFAMYLAKLQAGGGTSPPPKGIERFVFILDGAVNASDGKASKPVAQLHADDYVYFPPDHKGALTSDKGAGLLVWERRYAVEGGKPGFQHGSTAEKTILETPGEVFALRKLLPVTDDYDWNFHVMDFNPGQYLNVKEIHYNQHGLMLLQGQGIYRLGSDWYPVQAGDAILMAPYVPQWYCALGTQPSRYIINKDTTVNPLLS